MYIPTINDTFKGWKVVPPTSYQKYISGWEALNTPTLDNDAADWHPWDFWHDYAGVEMQIKLYHNDLLGSEGVSYRHIRYTPQKVHIASFARAFADLIYYAKSEDELGKLTYDCEAMLDDDDLAELYPYLKTMQTKGDKDLGIVARFVFLDQYRQEKEFWNRWSS